MINNEDMKSDLIDDETLKLILQKIGNLQMKLEIPRLRGGSGKSSVDFLISQAIDNAERHGIK